MTKREKNILEKWLEKAEHDLIAVENLIDVNLLILDIACFHCQQAVEKYLKAFLIDNQKKITKTHHLDFLLLECSELDEDFANIDVKNMEDFTIRARYPHDFVVPSLKETKEYFKIAVEVKKWF